MARRYEARNRKRTDREGAARRSNDGLRPETKQSIAAVACVTFAAVSLLAYWDLAGPLGRWMFRVLTLAVGRAYFVIPVTLIVAAFSFLLAFRRHIFAATMVGSGLGTMASLGLIDLLFTGKSGGWIGFAVNWPIERVFDFWAALVIESALLLVAVLIIANIPLFKPREDVASPQDREAIPAPPMPQEPTGVARPPESAEINPQPASAVMVESVARSKAPETETGFAVLKKRPRKSIYVFPPLDLLADDRGTPSSGDIRANANIIRRTLLNFGIDVEMGEVSVGPTVTQYTLKPAEGVKLSRIVALSNDLALALAAHPIRIEAPIPGKSLVGIEVPNRSIALVGLRSLIENEIFQKSEAPLLFALGRDVAGSPVYANLDRMPHLMIAGSTGSGKSVAIHSMITAFLYRNTPELLKFIIIDPKRVELSVYSGIPHLLAPPIIDARKTIQSLRWAVTEMERRYEMLVASGTRDIAGYNEREAKRSGELVEPMPYIVIVIDELADLMAAYPREVEGSIIRLAQMARAVGIHLVVSTQRPSVEVITGLIKANITSRIAFQVASQVDSRTILDVAGAEKLLGNGDMLFLAGDTAKPRRIQGGFISEEEVNRVTEFIRKQALPAVALTEGGEEIFEPGARAGESEFDFKTFAEGEEDPLYEEAKRLVIDARKASASYLQRRLKIGYARAARLLDLMEERGIIGPGEGAKPREILIREEISDA